MRSTPLVIEVTDGCPPVRIHGPAGTLSLTVLEPDEAASDPADAPILFLHPVNLSARCWLPTARLMRRFRRFLPDSRGHGDSHRNGPFNVADFAADTCAVIEALQIPSLHLVGASLGGSIACAVACAMPERVRSLVAVGASLEPADPETLARLHAWRLRGSIEQLFDEFLQREVARGLAPSVAAEARRQVGLGQREAELIKRITLSAFAEDARHFASGVSCPVLVLSGELDESCPPTAGERMAAALKGRFELLPGLGHLAMMQAPETLARKLTEFYERSQTHDVRHRCP